MPNCHKTGFNEHVLFKINHWAYTQCSNLKVDQLKREVTTEQPLHLNHPLPCTTENEYQNGKEFLKPSCTPPQHTDTGQKAHGESPFTWHHPLCAASVMLIDRIFALNCCCRRPQMHDGMSWNSFHGPSMYNFTAINILASNYNYYT